MKIRNKTVSEYEILQEQFDHFAKKVIKYLIKTVIRDYLSQRNRIRIEHIEDYENIAAPVVIPDCEKTKVAMGSVSILLENEILASGMRKLTKRHREVLGYAFISEMSDKAIAELMNLKYQTIRNYKHEAYDILRKHMTGDCDGKAEIQ